MFPQEMTHDLPLQETGRTACKAAATQITFGNVSVTRRVASRNGWVCDFFNIKYQLHLLASSFFITSAFKWFQIAFLVSIRQFFKVTVLVLVTKSAIIYFQGKAYALFLWILCIITLCGTTSAQIDNVPCDPIYAAKMIGGFCTSSEAPPNGLCCAIATSVVDRGVEIPCICSVIKAGVKADKLLRLYYLCGGKNPSAVKLPSRCGGAFSLL